MDELPPHLAALHRALQEEERAEREALDRLGAGALEDRVAAGVSWPLLRVERCERVGSRFEVELRAPRGVALHDGLGDGDPVSVWVHGRATKGYCAGHDGRVAEVALEDPVPDGAMAEVRLRADPRTWIRYRQALERGATLKSPLARALIDGVVDPGFGEGAQLSGLDPSQSRAADAALRATAIAAVHGPPGTGKTRLIAALLRCLVQRGERPWALADSNAAVDHLAATAARHGLEVVRIGRLARVRDDVRPLTLDGRLARSPFAPALAALDRDIHRASEAERGRLLDERRALRDRARAHVIDNAQVIACTFGTLARLAPDLPPTHTAIVDEATQATEPAVWTAVPFVKRVILVGDPEQLGPVSRVPGSALERSLLQRLLADGLVAAPMLEVQHRMDHRLRAQVVDVYGVAYTDHPDVADQPLHALPGVAHTELTACGVRFVDTAGAGLSEEEDPVSRSLRNPGEGAVVVAAVEALRAAGVRAADIAVITPYAAQVAWLSERLPEVEVSTVNAIQGREKEVVVASWVRSNEDGALGFVADGRRLTVALTRARRLAVHVGDGATLSTHPRFAALLDRLAASGDLVSVFEPPWADALAG